MRPTVDPPVHWTPFVAHYCGPVTVKKASSRRLFSERERLVPSFLPASALPRQLPDSIAPLEGDKRSRENHCHRNEIEPVCPSGSHTRCYTRNGFIRLVVFPLNFRRECVIHTSSEPPPDSSFCVQGAFGHRVRYGCRCHKIRMPGSG